MNLDDTTGTSLPTIFEGKVLINQGAGGDDVRRAGPGSSSGDAHTELVIFKTFVIHHGSGFDSTSLEPTREIFPFGNKIEWIP